MELVSCLLVTGQVSPETCQILLIALRSSAPELLAAASSTNPASRVPLTLCDRFGQPLLSNLEESLLDERLGQVIPL